MRPHETPAVDWRHATDSWEKQFLQNVEVLRRLGVSGADAQDLVNDFILHARRAPPVSALRPFDDPSTLEATSLLTEAEPRGRAFMLRLLAPVMSQVTVRGTEHLGALAPLVGKVPITLVSNHLSHLDAPAIFAALWHAPEPGRELARRLVFLAGRFASQAQFARLGLSMFGSFLVCSPRDMHEHEELHDLMGRINRRAFRQARRLQADGRVLALFPEGARSFDGQPHPFLASLYPYLANTVVIPVRLHNTQALLPNSGLVFRKGNASVSFGKPVAVGNLPLAGAGCADGSLPRIEAATETRTRQAVLDDLAECVSPSRTTEGS
jgi:1-acyl-sn-glycerol-3-phosphate acyltransferase